MNGAVLRHRLDSLADVNPHHRRLVIPAALAMLLMIVVLASVLH